jgi:hypothetical protein
MDQMTKEHPEIFGFKDLQFNAEDPYGLKGQKDALWRW